MKNSLLQENFELIKSLSKNEKRYFKLFTQFQQGDKSYMKLFDILDRQKDFHEKMIDKKFLHETKTTNYPLIKKYLFEQIILALKSYGAYKDLDSDHTDLIETYKVLQYKGLHGQSDKLLKKIKAITLADVLCKRRAALHQNGMFAAADPVRAEPAFKSNQSAEVLAYSEALTPRNSPLAYAGIELNLQLVAVGALMAPLGRGWGRQ